MSTKIEWTDETVNIVTGCENVSPGCDHCYAATWAGRGMGQWKGRDFGTVLCHEDRLPLLSRGKTERRKFVCSMADMFHSDVSDEFLNRAFDAMYDAVHCPHRHTLQVLTKRPERMRRVVAKIHERWNANRRPGLESYMPEGLWLGVSIESNDYTWRADMLRETPAAIRWISFEPLLAPCDRVDLTGIDWVVIGGESGHGARPMHVAWVREIVERARAVGAAVFVKQMGTVWARLDAGVRGVRCTDTKGGDMALWPEDIRVREYPTLRDAA